MLIAKGENMDSISVIAERSANEMKVQKVGHLHFFYSDFKGKKACKVL